MRYQFTDKDKRFDGKNVYRTTYYPVIPPNYDDVYIIAGPNDYLDSIAYKYYGDESYWWIIARANGLGHGKLNVTEGMQLRIPQNISYILQQLKNIN